jgi:hypothetical protein
MPELFRIKCRYYGDRETIEEKQNEHAAGVVRADDIVVNQADDQAGIELAVRFAAELRAYGDETPVAAGSVREHRLERV